MKNVRPPKATIDRPGLVRPGKHSGLTKRLEALQLGCSFDLIGSKQSEVGSTLTRVGRRLNRIFTSRVIRGDDGEGVRVFRVS